MCLCIIGKHWGSFLSHCNKSHSCYFKSSGVKFGWAQVQTDRLFEFKSEEEKAVELKANKSSLENDYCTDWFIYI